MQASFPVAFAAFDPWPVSPRDSPPCGMALQPSDLPAPRSFTHSFHRQSLEASCWPSPRLHLRGLSLLAHRPPRGWSHPAPGVPTAPQSPCLDDRLPQFLSLASPATPAVAQSQMPVMRASSLLSSHPTFYRSHPGPENVSGIWPPLS